MDVKKNRDGQPINTALNFRRRESRNTDELLGICRGLAADGSLNADEAKFLQSWLSHNREIADTWPAGVLLDRLNRVFQDGIYEASEEQELLSLLMATTGGDVGKLTDVSLSSGLPLNEPMPIISVPSRRFCFTGKFISGSRDACHESVIVRGGFITESVRKDLDYLVIGVIGSRDWVHSSYGRKIQKAVEYRESGVPLVILSERHFLDAVGGSPS